MALSLGEKRNMAGMNSGITTIARQMRIDDIKTREDFEQLFPINTSVLFQIMESMKKSGYDQSQPVHVWKEEGILVDGHTRRQAAIDAGLLSIPVYEHSFSSAEEAMEYALGLQVARRNLSDAEILNAISRLDKLKNKGRISDDNSETIERGKSATQLADLLGTSTTKIEKARTVEKKADDEVKAAVASGEMSLNAAYQKVKAPMKKEDPQKTLFQMIKRYSADELSAYLETVQKEAVQGKSRTQTEWLDELKQLRIEGGE